MTAHKTRRMEYSDVERIRKMAATKSQTEISKIERMSLSTINKIVSGKTYRPKLNGPPKATRLSLLEEELKRLLAIQDEDRKTIRAFKSIQDKDRETIRDLEDSITQLEKQFKKLLNNLNPILEKL